MGNRNNILILAVTGLILAWIWLKRPTEEPATAHRSLIHQKLSPKTAPATALTRTETPDVDEDDGSDLHPIAAAEQTDPHKPPKGAVPFDLINGYVIAYGDIVLGKPTTEDFPQNGFIEAPKLHLWEKGVIPFSVHNSLPDPDRVLRVIAYLNEYTPLHFVPYEGQTDSIVFFPMDGLCLSYLGKSGGNQPIYLDFRCTDHEILHEVMHALGFIHEHSRADRDQYVRVNWDNVEPDKADQFDVSPLSLNDPLKNRPFDYKSVMLYPTSAFARDRGAPTLISTGDQTIEPTQNGLSAEDLERVRLLYGGSSAPPTGGGH